MSKRAALKKRITQVVTDNPELKKIFGDKMEDLITKSFNESFKEISDKIKADHPGHGMTIEIIKKVFEKLSFEDYIIEVFKEKMKIKNEIRGQILGKVLVIS